jgi:putative transposase
MINLRIEVSEMRSIVNSIKNNSEGIFNYLGNNYSNIACDFINSALQAEFNIFIGRDAYQRSTSLGVDKNYRNGFYERSLFIKNIGEIKVTVPRARNTKFTSNLLKKHQRIDDRIRQDCLLLYLNGLSTRNLELISERLFGKKISHSEVSIFSEEIAPKIKQWRSRPIVESYKYLYIDGTNFKMRIKDSIEKVTVLVVIGVNEKNQKQVLALQAGDKESAPTWRELFKDLKSRGLDSEKVKLGIMDGLPGLEKVFEEEFTSATTQRCQVHVARNILTKVPKKLSQEVADHIRSIFYSKSREKSEELFKIFKNKYSVIIPSAVETMEKSLDSTLRFFNFPEEEWTSLRTTNPIERLNKEFKRRTKSMEIVAGENSCYNLLTIIALKMEAHWRKCPIDKKFLPWENFKIEFTQNN